MSLAPAVSGSLASPFAYDSFVSYCQQDRQIAEQVEALLKGLGLRVWRDPQLTEQAHRSFIDEINRAHQSAARVLVLWSKNSVGSRWVKEEAEAAANQDRLVALSVVPFAEVEIPIGFRCLPTATLAQVAADPELLRKMLHPETDLHALSELAKPNTGLPDPHLNTKELPATYTSTLYGRGEELTFLISALDSAKTRIVAYDAMGGTGKTALLFRFVQRLVLTDWRGLESVFTWSFYSQGSSEDKQSHAADFFKSAYAHFHPDGAKAKLPEDPREQGAQLADLITQQATLLILDGLEPLQYAAGGYTGTRQIGGIKDPGIKTLLLRLAKRRKAGLTVITTRIQLHELEDRETFARRHLEQLPTGAAIDLLRDRGIEQAAFPRDAYPELPAGIREEFVRAIAALENHALSLNLAAHLVAEQHDGQIKAFAEVLPHLQDDSGIHEGHRSPFRVIRALEAGLYRVLHNRLRTMSATEAVTDSPAANQLALLYFLGLFDRPASLKLLPVVYDATPDLREAIVPGDKQEYLDAIAKAAAERDAVLANSALSDDAHQEARHRFEDAFYDLSFAYWLPPVLARFDPKADERNQSVLNALGQLARQGLVSKARLREGEGGHAEWETLPPEKWFDHHVDCHPLIREYFGHQLRTRYEPAFQAAHGRLYDHFRYEGLPEEFREPVAYAFLALDAAYPNDPDFETGKMMRPGYPPHLYQYLTPPLLALIDGSDSSIVRLKAADTLRKSPAGQTALQRFLPATEAGMTPLFAAIGHGCLAGRYECFNEVYRPRISRGNEGYAMLKLGLFGQDLAALANFFEKPFQVPSSQLHASDRALVLNCAGFALRAIGRLPDAVEPFRAGIEMRTEQANLLEAARDSGNLSELLLTLGHLERDDEGQPGALPTAEKAVHFADQSGDEFQPMNQRAKEANARLAAGCLRQAEARFREAEALQKERQPELPRLYSFPGFLYGELLLDRRRPQEVAERSAYGLNEVSGLGLLSYALAEVNQARARSLGGTPLADGGLAQALAALLNANQEDDIPRGYLAMAECGLLNADCDGQAIDEALTEAETRAKRGPMPLFLTEVYLLRSRLSVVRGPLSKAKEFRDQAAELIRKHGYGRRVPDLAVLDCELDPCLENFQTACAKVGEEGWWHLMPRLEALVESQPTGLFGLGGPRKHWHHLLEPLRRAEKAYHAERDAYLRKVEGKTT